MRQPLLARQQSVLRQRRLLLLNDGWSEAA
jgi:hypothetical protein